MKRILKTVLMVLLSLIILAGATLALVYFEVLPAPGILQSIPVINRLADQDRSPVTVPSPSEIEEQGLRKRIQGLENEIKNLQRQLKKVETERSQADNSLKQVNQQLEEFKQAQDLSTAEEQVFKELAKYYSSIKPKSSAAVFAELDDETVIGILQKMDPEDVARVLAALPAPRAALITQKMLRIQEPGT